VVFLLIIAGVNANTCFTVVNSPQGDKLYWKAISYDIILNDQFTDYLDKSTRISTPDLGPGYQYNIRVDKECFGDYLLSTSDNSGADSGSIFIQEETGDYKAVDAIDRFYTISRSDAPDNPNYRVKDITQKVFDSISYVNVPTITDSAYTDMKEGLCDPNLLVTEQLDRIIGNVWLALDHSVIPLGCTGFDNIAGCALDKGSGDTKAYATTIALLARECGIPARVVYGISEGTFDGIDIKFSELKKHYWIEYYDNAWRTLETAESGSTRPSSIETNCIDGIDNNNDGKKDCKDPDCASRSFCIGDYPTTTKFDNAESTDLEGLGNVFSVNYLKLGNNHGAIVWEDQGLDLRDLNLDSSVDIAENKLILTSAIPVLDTDSFGILNNIEESDPTVLKDGIVCDDCDIITYADNVITFAMTGSGIYSIKDEDELLVTEIITNSTNMTNNVSYLPEIPLSENPDTVTKVLDFVKEWFGKLMDASNLTKIIIIAGILIVVIFLKSRRRY
jgi:hypothetical protein